MADKVGPEQKSPAQDECCGGHCETGADENLKAQEATEASPAEEEIDPSTLQKETDWKLQSAYLAAEIENIQKRAAREASEIRKYANEDLLKRLVPTLDNLKLALDAAEKARALPENKDLFSNKIFQSLLQGVEMTANSFEQSLLSAGVEFIESKGKAFDPSLHEALGRSQAENVEDNIVTEEFQRGIKLGGRVVRPAKVIVNKV